MKTLRVTDMISKRGHTICGRKYIPSLQVFDNIGEHCFKNLSAEL